MDLKSRLNLPLVLIILSWISSGQAQSRISRRSSSLHKSIYTELNAKAFCFRRTNGTHQFGCSSDPGGNVGVIHLIQEEEDVDWMVEKGQHAPYIGMILTIYESFCRDKN